MIAASVVLLIAAIATLAVGWFQDGLAMVYVSIGASVAALISLVAGVARRRAVTPATATAGAPFGPEEGTEAAATAPAEPSERAEPRAAPAPQRRPAARPSTGGPKEAGWGVGARPDPGTPSAKKPAATKPSSAKKAGPASGPSPRSRVISIPQRGTFHRPGCRFVKGRGDTERITLGTAEKRGYAPCGVCTPDAPA